MKERIIDAFEKTVGSVIIISGVYVTLKTVSAITNVVVDKIKKERRARKMRRKEQVPFVYRDGDKTYVMYDYEVL